MSVPVPTVPELAKMGAEFAEAIDWTKDGKATKWRVHPAGHRLMGEAMRQNAEEAVARGDGDWVQPPSNNRVKVTV